MSQVDRKAKRRHLSFVLELTSGCKWGGDTIRALTIELLYSRCKKFQHFEIGGYRNGFQLELSVDTTKVNSGGRANYQLDVDFLAIGSSHCRMRDADIRGPDSKIVPAIC